jgi:DNA-binding CsgD family transcriptional regulator
LYEKINYLISFSIPIWVVLLVENLYGGIEKKYILAFLGPLFLVHIFVLLSPARVFTHANEAFQLYAAVIFSIAFGMLLHAALRRYTGAKVFLTAYMIFTASTLSVMLFTKDLISANPILPLSFLSSYKLPISDRLFISWDVVSYILLLVMLTVFGISFFYKDPAATKRSFSIADSTGKDRFRARTVRFQFSDRETEVCILTLRGKSNKEIGEELYLSLSTVKTYLSRIFRKTGVKTRAELFFLFYDPDTDHP